MWNMYPFIFKGVLRILWVKFSSILSNGKDMWSSWISLLSSCSVSAVVLEVLPSWGGTIDIQLFMKFLTTWLKICGWCLFFSLLLQLKTCTNFRCKALWEKVFPNSRIIQAICSLVHELYRISWFFDRHAILNKIVYMIKKTINSRISCIIYTIAYNVHNNRAFINEWRIYFSSWKNNIRSSKCLSRGSTTLNVIQT